MATQEREVLAAAQRLYRLNPDWVTFYREVFGLSGIVRTAFTTGHAIDAFNQTPEYQEIQKLLADLRAKAPDGDGKETMRVITVRLPQSVHESLRREAEERGTSMNKLAVSKLMQPIDGDLVPTIPVPIEKEDTSVASAS